MLNTESEVVVLVRRVVVVTVRRSNVLRVVVPAPTTVNAVGTFMIVAVQLLTGFYAAGEYWLEQTKQSGHSNGDLDTRPAASQSLLKSN